MLPWRILQMDVGMVTHKQHQCYINEGLPAGKAVGIVKPMPDKIQHINGKAGVKQNQHGAVHCFFPERNLLTAQIEQEEHEHCHTAVYIRPVVQPYFGSHISYVAGNHVKNGKIGGKCLGKVKIP